MKRRTIELLWVDLFAVFLLVGYAMGQSSSSGGQEQARAAQYFLGSQDQVLMGVNIWGFVNKPGQYMVPYDTDLISLLSYAGGPREEAKITGIKVVRGAKNGGNKEPGEVIQVDVKKWLKNGKADAIPVLRPGDTVVVSGTSFYFVSKFFEFTWRIAAIVQVWALIDYYSAAKK
jgi:polysaccharide export outer membrane protein